MNENIEEKDGKVQKRKDKVKDRIVSPVDVESAISNAWLKLGLDEKVGKLTTYASDIRNDYRSLETMLTDQLPPDMFGIRKKILDGKIPDAHIRSTVGIICIDSKFPLDNYRKAMETKEPGEQEARKRNC